MVMYRDFAQRNARKLGLTGFVRNENDGSVWVVAEGSEEALKKFQTKLARGPMFSRVEDIEVEWKEPTGKFRDFMIDYGSN